MTSGRRRQTCKGPGPARSRRGHLSAEEERQSAAPDPGRPRIVSQEAAEDAQAAEAIANSDVKVSEADAAIAAVVQDDAAAQHRLDTSCSRSMRCTRHSTPSDRPPQGTRQRRQCRGAGIHLIAPQSIWVRAHVDEALAGGLAVGQTAFVRLRSEMDQCSGDRGRPHRPGKRSATEERRVYVRCRVCSSSHELRFLGEQAEIEIVKR